MADMIDDIAHLTQDIGPHPAGTEEEQQAALYLAEELQKGAGFSTILEDVRCVTNDQIPQIACFTVALVASLVALVVPIVGIPCFILVVSTAVLYGLEVFGKPVISRLLSTGQSQNVVAKYQPAMAGNAKRRRKVILVANYDSGHILREEQAPFASFIPIVQKASAIALAVAALVLFFRSVVFVSDTGAISSMLSFILVLCIILFILPVVRSALHITSPYSQSANNNATGVAVMLDVARQIGNGLVSNEELAERAEREGGRVHGEEAARAAGVAPEGADLSYDRELSSTESLAAAKAAIAALTGKPVADKVPVADISSRLVKGGGLDPEEEKEASAVHFEVSDTPKPRTPRQMVEAAEEERREGSQAAAEESPAAISEEIDDAERWEEPQFAQFDTQAPSRHPIERATPAALRNELVSVTPISPFTGDPMSSDKTPAWARKAQEKARANKPEPTQSRKVRRSKYADAPAAAIADASTTSVGSPVTAEVSTPEASSELDARLAALRSEIESTEAPQISEEAKAALDHMDEPAAPASSGVSSAEATDSAASAPVESASTTLDSQRPVPKSEERPHPQGAFVRARVSASQDVARETIDKQEVAEQASVEATAPIPVSEPPRQRTAFERDEYGSHSDSVESDKTSEPTASKGEPMSERVGDAVAAAKRAWSHHRLGGSRNRSRVIVPAEEETSAVAQIAETPADDPTMKAPASREIVEEAHEVSAPIVSSSSPSATAAISPIDVSAFLDKEKEEMPVEKARPQVRRRPVRPAVKMTQDVAAEDTQRVSSERIQEAIQEVSDVGVSLNKGAAESIPASPIMGMEDMLPEVPLDTKASNKQQKVIVLPDVVSTHATADEQKQRAPMADASESTKAGTKSLLSNMLPRIGDSGTLQPVAPSDVHKDTFGADLPPLSPADDAPSAVSMTSSFSTVGGTGSFAPVGDELVADIDPENRYVDDADDSAFDEEYTETGAFAGPGYVDMPKSRAGRLFGRFRSKKKNKEQETSVREWVDVDENYNARSVGKARGTWSSFRNEDASADTATAPSGNDSFVDVDYRDTDFTNRRDWNGGAFSLSRLRKSREAEPTDAADYAYEFHSEEAQAEAAPVEIRNSGYAAPMDDTEAVEQLNREMNKLHDFRHPDINTEVWFVALGAEYYSHSGICAFLDDHASELKGAIVINLEGLGAGSLSCIEREGSIRSYTPSSRVKRFLRQASERSGVGYRTGMINSRETPATIAMQRGVSAFTIAGLGENNTALYSQDNDIIENIDTNMLADASKFVMAVLKSI